MSKRKIRKDGLPKGTPRQWDIRLPPKPRTALTAVARRNSGSQPAAEQIMQRALSERYGALFLSQWVISEFIVDFAAPILGIVIEVDGSSHARALVRARDELQEAAVEEMGGITLRFTNEQVRHEMPAVLATIHAAILARVHLRAHHKLHDLYGWRLPKKARRALMEEAQGKEPIGA